VEVPSPVSGKVLKLAGNAGDIVVTGAMLAEFAPDASLPQRADGQDTGHSHGPPKRVDTSAAPRENLHVGAASSRELPPKQEAKARAGDSAPKTSERDDAGTVVGAMQSSNAVHQEQAVAVGGVRAMPAVRALAKKLGLDLSRVRATGAEGTVTMADVKAAAAGGDTALLPSPTGRGTGGEGTEYPDARAHAVPSSALRAPSPEGRREEQQRTSLSATGKPMRTQPPGVSVTGQPEQLKGVRRNMARVMADAHAKVVPTTLNDDADVHAWQPGNDVTVRLIRSIVRACKAVPALNAWFDGEKLNRTLHPQVDIGIAVDTDDGLFVPALRNADILDARGIREGVNRLRAQVEDRSIAASELGGYTISLSNFGMFAGRYATPVVVPPCVAIVAAGRARHQVMPIMGGFESHKIIPLSVTFDHRAATGGEAARFLKAMIDDLSLAT
jgi:pyruvate dehydrogenase E2 component (dihydrolipoamide acetyltransferase)